jgi:hypothetical protein
MSDFQGLPTYNLSNGLISLDVLVGAGPRIVRLSAFGKGNLFADIAASVSTPYGEYRYRGGHRLWHAPEALPRTYIPDDDGVSIEQLGDGILMTGPVEMGTGISKSIEVHLSADQPSVSIRHSLHNNGLWPLELAPWAITMFRLGGIVILPQPVGVVSPNSLINNRVLALWPYSQINDSRVVLRDDFILIRAFRFNSPFKIGYYNPHGWIGYWLDGVLFRKMYDVTPGANYVDGGCNGESYLDSRFVELESLGPLATLGPGDVTFLNETWELYPGLNVPFLSSEIGAFLRNGWPEVKT